MRRGQLWSSDFMISLLIFVVASLIALTMLINALQDDRFAEVNAQAEAAADLLAAPGHPEYWIEPSVLRAGLRSGDHLSLRKAREFAKIDEQRLRTALRVTDDVYVYVTNQSNDTVAVFGQCAVGMHFVPSTPANFTLPATAISVGPHPVSDALGLSVYPPDSALVNLSRFDVVVIEGNLTTSMSTEQARLLLEDASRRGITFVFIGDPGVPVLGVNVNATPATSIVVQGSAGRDIGLNDSENITLAATIATIEAPTVPVAQYTVVGITDANKTAYATWLYNDATVWYLASADGTISDGTSVVQTLGDGLEQVITIPWPDCGNVTVPDAKQIALHRRTLAYHDQLLTINVLVWRTR